LAVSAGKQRNIEGWVAERKRKRDARPKGPSDHEAPEGPKTKG
jgi:hypothetical protein